MSADFHDIRVSLVGPAEDLEMLLAILDACGYWTQYSGGIRRRASDAAWVAMTITPPEEKHTLVVFRPGHDEQHIAWVQMMANSTRSECSTCGKRGLVCVCAGHCYTCCKCSTDDLPE